MLGREGSQNYLNIDKWTSMDLKTIEHIAPQSNNDGMWDIELYDTNTELYQTLGNLTLLPQNLNASAGKKVGKRNYFTISVWRKRILTSCKMWKI